MPEKRTNRARALEMIKARPITVKDLIAEFDCDYKLAWDLLKRMHIARQVHVIAWGAPATGKAVPIYGAGPGDDAARPLALTNAESSRRSYARRNWGATPAAIDIQLTRRKSRLQQNYSLQEAEITRALNIIQARKRGYDDVYKRAVAELEASAATARKALGLAAARPETAELSAIPEDYPLLTPASPMSILGQLQGVHR